MKKLGISKKILLADDLEIGKGTERSEKTRKYASLIAKRLGASIDLLHVENELPSGRDVDGIPEYKSLLAQYMDNQTASIERRLKSISVPAKTLLATGEAGKQIVAVGQRSGQYLCIVMGTRGRKGLGRVLLGSVAETVIRTSKVPVLTLGPEFNQSVAEARLQTAKPKILVASTLTGNSRPAETYAVTLARRLGGAVVLYHNLMEDLHPVLRTALMSSEGAYKLGDMVAGLHKPTLKKLEKRAAELEKLFGVEVAPQLDAKHFIASIGICKVAERSDAALLVLGTHGRKLISGAFFGRTVRDVILESSVPVVSVQSKRK